LESRPFHASGGTSVPPLAAVGTEVPTATLTSILSGNHGRFTPLVSPASRSCCRFLGRWCKARSPWPRSGRPTLGGKTRQAVAGVKETGREIIDAGVWYLGDLRGLGAGLEQGSGGWLLGYGSMKEEPRILGYGSSRVEVQAFPPNIGRPLSGLHLPSSGLPAQHWAPAFWPTSSQLRSSLAFPRGSGRAANLGRASALLRP
jgi:hypothetical protein